MADILLLFEISALKNMDDNLQKRTLIMALYAGELMMKNGAEVYRVEDTIHRICKAYNYPYVEVFAMPTGIFASVDDGENSGSNTYIKRIKGSNIDLDKISKLNDFSRKFTSTDLSVLSTLGCALVFHVPKKHLIFAALTGGCGWCTYSYFASVFESKIFGCFVAAIVVAFIGDILSRALKDASTLFIIPGIIPLVPGSGMYYTMLDVIHGNFAQAASTGTETILMSGAIATGLLVFGSILKAIITFPKKLITKN